MISITGDFSKKNCIDRYNKGAGLEVRGALRFRLEAKKKRTIFASNLRPRTSILQTT
jgi:hypothetical protein